MACLKCGHALHEAERILSKSTNGLCIRCHMREVSQTEEFQKSQEEMGIELGYRVGKALFPERFQD